ncbi:MAG TPA: homoserine kinase [Frankiaceae bacterium]|nr:homoserine kinase [Frankiaceae bacterium]
MIRAAALAAPADALRASPVRVRVPATSANLGPGFDACGLALALYDDVVVRAGDDGVVVAVTGEDDVPRDERHLVVRAVRAGLAALGIDAPGLEVSCVNRVPHGRGLGSSAAAITAGVVAAGALARTGMPDDLALRVACELEGHPDNVAACLLGGFTLSWYERGRARAVRLEPAAGLSPVVFVPAARASTAQSRADLPAAVPHADAAAAAGRAALLVHALTVRPDLLLAATEDRLHQPYRLPAMPATAALLRRLREAGVPAVLSGSGPTVLALAGSPGQAERAAGAEAAGFDTLALDVDGRGARIVPLSG